MPITTFPVSTLANGTKVYKASCQMEPIFQTIVFETVVCKDDGYNVLLENTMFFAGTRSWYSKHDTIYLTRAEAEQECHRWVDQQISFMNREREKISDKN